MFTFRIVHAGVYRHAQTGSWRNPWATLSLYVRGLQWRRDASGTTTAFEPGVLLRPAGYLSEFAYGADRENWVVGLDGIDLVADDTPDMVRLGTPGGPVRMARFTPVSRAGLAHLRSLFTQVTDHYRDPSPHGQLHAASAVMSIVGTLLDRQHTDPSPSPAARLKQLMDADETWTRSIDELSRTCGYGVDHMRALFEREFGMKPHAYRHQRRLIAATQLLEHTPLRIKEIAARLGFRHVSHFCMAYRAAYNEAPGAARRRGTRQTPG